MDDEVQKILPQILVSNIFCIAYHLASIGRWWFSFREWCTFYKYKFSKFSPFSLITWKTTRKINFPSSCCCCCVEYRTQCTSTNMVYKYKKNLKINNCRLYQHSYVECNDRAVVVRKFYPNSAYALYCSV